MATVLILGGGFGAVVAAERLAQQLSAEHQITLVSRSRNFVFSAADAVGVRQVRNEGCFI